MLNRSVVACNWIIVGLLCLGGIGIACGYRVNVQQSVPPGVYRVTKTPSVLSPGMLVLVSAPPAIHSWLRGTGSVVKPVAGVAGDHVCAHEKTLWINARNYGPIHDTANGTRLPRITGCFTLQPGELFLASTAPRSLDSRYFGPLPTWVVRGLVTPVWTWLRVPRQD